MKVCCAGVRADFLHLQQQLSASDPLLVSRNSGHDMSSWVLQHARCRCKSVLAVNIVGPCMSNAGNACYGLLQAPEQTTG